MPHRHTALAGAVAATLSLAGAAFAQSTTPSATTPNLGAAGQPVTQQGQRGGQDAGATAQSVNPTPMPPGSRAGNAPGMGGTTGPAGPANQGAAGGQAGTAPRVAPADPAQPQGGRGQAATTAPDTAGTRAQSAPGTRAESAPGASVGAGTAPATVPPGQAAAPLPGSRQPAGTERPGTTAQRPLPDGTTTTSPGAGAGTMPPGTTATAPGTPGAATGATRPAAPVQGGGEARREGAPLSGANSFTEGQARARIADAGYADVQQLRLDEQGVWRGRAMRNGQMTGVAMDYQGNIVATP
ncbi:hypothetical protein [Falsiroseomonas tokyonensis]|uniref:PepSY domain-containing protein n=1 Tax=Falsiroseomonas tokyonensis TaxID=430521 RepID=A0ABV7BVL5_9PROT|nr:hypothetical protein [Falsiroseomonas tokyonensis]MBU8539723.1 hypothetical protein [Falsiroseomonas tokyonensis]